MHPKSIALTAFSTPDGHFEFTRLPFGLKNAPADFSRIMYQILGQLPFVKIYLDDVTIHSDTFENHLQHIDAVLQNLRIVNLKINGDKCKWFRKQLKLLGHIISGKAIEMDPTKLEAVRNMKPPTTVKQLQQFLGLCNYYRRFVRAYADITAPLNQLLKKANKWQWTTAEQNAFNHMKNRLTSAPILRQPKLDQPFVLFTDASSLALGAILAQKDDKSNE